ncbi:glycosyltransferase family 92 protein RCOM_0530710-like [Syzygium oleosum]|uniref:glycosyltransferase family 92 protein RCOM_0530710-like n=1 Tax=Syzygium oleosum TaxID=219896 RepID=UPI0024B8B156|nr:glycosyltransferase family 92 protein RCOM_0530710-like [Syzygium oleosum]
MRTETGGPFGCAREREAAEAVSMAARDRRTGGRGGGDVSWSRFFWCTIFAVLSCVLFTVFTFSTLRLSFGETFQPVVVPSWRNPAMRAVSSGSEPAPLVSIRETVPGDSAKLWLKQPPAVVDSDDSREQIVRCPLAENGSLMSLAFESDEQVPPRPSHRWGSLVYEAVIDRDNTTVVSTSGMNSW